MLTLFCFPELFSFVCGHSFPTSSIFMSATGTGASRGAVSSLSLLPSLSPSFRFPVRRAQYNPSVGTHSHLQPGVGGSSHSAAPFGKPVCPSLNSHSSQSHNTSRHWDSCIAARQRGNSHLQAVLTWGLSGGSPPSFALSFSSSLTFLWQALDGGRLYPLLHVPIVQHLVVGGQAAVPQLVCSRRATGNAQPPLAEMPFPRGMELPPYQHSPFFLAHRLAHTSCPGSQAFYSHRLIGTFPVAGDMGINLCPSPRPPTPQQGSGTHPACGGC